MNILNRKLREEKGITLITLIVTIIVLLIMTVVAVNIALGENGIFLNSKKITDKYKIQAAKEKLEMKLSDLQMEIVKNAKKDRLELSDLIVINSQEENMEVETTKKDDNGNEIEETVKIYTDDKEQTKYAIVIVDGYAFKVKENLEIEYMGNYEKRDPERTDTEREDGYEEEVVDENDTGEIVLDKDIVKDEIADEMNLEQVPEGWIGIYTETDLINMKSDLKAKYILMADLKLTKTWTPLGSSNTEFTGYFNGNGHAITNMKVSGTSGYLGMFAKTGGTANITNLTLKNYTISGNGNYIGGLVRI